MRRLGVSVLAMLAVDILSADSGLADEQMPKNDSADACMQMMQSAGVTEGVTEEGRKVRRHLMEGSDMGGMMGGMNGPTSDSRASEAVR